MKINIWIKSNQIEKLKELTDVDSIGSTLKNKHKDFEFYYTSAGPITTGFCKAVQVLIDYDSFIQIRDNFEGF
tara:strand:- start:13 stop:231 length:219 start_codon:yes stop_codon:yes gene_type:complete